MKGTIEYLGRGLLVLALCGWVVGCGDDDDSGNDDGGVDSGTSGSGGTTGGSGGSTETDGGGGGTGGGGTGGSGTVTMAQCVSMTNTNTGNGASDECVSCVCENDAETTVACDSNCWALISCVGAKCGGDASDLTCFTDADKCMKEVGVANTAAAMALGDVIDMKCSDKCVATSSPNDGGAEDGGN